MQTKEILERLKELGFRFVKRQPNCEWWCERYVDGNLVLYPAFAYFRSFDNRVHIFTRLNIEKPHNNTKEALLKLYTLAVKDRLGV